MRRYTRAQCNVICTFPMEVSGNVGMSTHTQIIIIRRELNNTQARRVITRFSVSIYPFTSCTRIITILNTMHKWVLCI